MADLAGRLARKVEVLQKGASTRDEVHPAIGCCGMTKKVTGGLTGMAEDAAIHDIELLLGQNVVRT